MSFIKELKQLIKYFFTGTPKTTTHLEIITMKHFPFNGFNAMSWCGKIITRNLEYLDDTTIRHETTHLKQAQQYNSWFAYYLSYLFEWLKGNPFKKPYISAYYTIPFEVEAYANENHIHYNNEYDKTLLKTKYTFKKRKELFLNFASLSEWKNFIKNL